MIDCMPPPQHASPRRARRRRHPRDGRDGMLIRRASTTGRRSRGSTSAGGDRGRCGPKCRGAPWPRGRCAPTTSMRAPSSRSARASARIRVELAPVLGGYARAARRARAGDRPRSGGGSGPVARTYDGRWAEEVERSLITLKALTFEPTGGDRRGADDVAAGVPRRRAQLGLPLLLAPRRGAHAGRADGRRLRRRGDELPRLGAPRRRRRPGGHPDHVRPRRRAPARTSTSCRCCRATRVRRRCASGTRRPGSCSSTSTAS